VTKRSLSREIGFALALKAVMLAALYFLFFNDSHRPVVAPAKMAAFLAHEAPSQK
jgi:hypothetical protein